MSSWFIRRANVTAGGGPEPTPGRLPAGYTELAYLQSDGNQYINTGIVPTAATDVTIDMQITSISVSRYILGRYKSNGQFYLYVGGNASTPYFQFAWSSIYANYTGSTIDTNRHVIRLYSDGSTSHLNIDGSDVFNRTTVDHSGNTLPLTLFRGGDNTVYGGMPQKIWSAVVKNNGVKVMELVPAKRIADDVVGMYDLVSGTFLTNAWSGSFLYGEL